MMLIRLKHSVACEGHFDYKAGDLQEVSEYWAKRLVTMGAAIVVPVPAENLPPPVKKRKIVAKKDKQ